MNPDDFFQGNGVGLAVLERVLAAVEPCGDVEVRTSKSQVAFRRRRGFAYLWRPEQYLRRPAPPVVLSFALGRRVDSARFKQVVQPSPRHWMHHLEIRAASEIDDEVVAWLREAADRAG